MDQRTARLDPITLTVIQSGLQQVCNEMDLAFVRAAFSPVVSGALDRSDGVIPVTSTCMFILDTCARCAGSADSFGGLSS